MRTAYMHGYTTQRYAHRTLAADSEDGAYRLDLEERFDLTIHNYVADHGNPDYLRVEDSDNVYLYYLSEDLAVQFVRRHGSVSTATKHRPIPAEQKSWLPLAAAPKLREAALAAAPPATPTALDQCFAKCRELTDRSKEECFDVCRE